MKLKVIITSFTCALFLSLGVSLIMPISAQAQKADLNIGISPPLTHIVIQPGKTAITTVTVENQGLYDVDLTPNFVDFKSDNKSGIPVLSDEMSFSYITLEDANVQLNKPWTLKVGEKKQLVFEIALPENSNEKEYHFSLVLDVEPIQNSLRDRSQTTVTGQIVTNFIVTVTQSAKDQGVINLKSFEAPLFVDSLGAIPVEVLMENTGKNTTVTQGSLKITNLLGNIVYEEEILSQNILPGSSRQIFAAQDDTINGEEVKTEKPFRYKGWFLLGPYHLSLSYHAPGQDTQTFSHTVFAFPISVLIFIVLVYIVYSLYTRTDFFQGVWHKVSKKNEKNHE